MRSETERLLSSRDKQSPLVDTVRRQSNRWCDKRLKAFNKDTERLHWKHPRSQVLFWLFFIVVLVVILIASLG